ncbi:MAG: hypothetical protein J6Q94_09285 [Clostridia bacterium]|nr:hypothetical protein [Clostridia bacterium]
MLTISIDRRKISTLFKATVTVQSDEAVYACEARATKTGQPYGKGIGYDLLSDDISVSDGIVTFGNPVSSFAFDIESPELEADGDYRISIYVMNADGVWNDCCQLYTSSADAVRDSQGAYVLVKRDGSGSDSSYTSAYSGNDINKFVTEVLR